MPTNKSKSSNRKRTKEKDASNDIVEESSDLDAPSASTIILTPRAETNSPYVLTAADDPNSTDLSPESLTQTIDNNQVSINVAHGHSTTKESAVWKHAIKNDDETASCRLCPATLKVTNGSTTGLRKHLSQQHGIQGMAPKKTNKTTQKFSPPLKRELHTLIIRAIVKDGRSFDDFRRPGMMNVLQKLVPGMSFFLTLEYI